MGAGGGGAIMRGVARLVGAGAAIGASSSSSPAALCHARPADSVRSLTVEQQQMQQDQEAPPSSKPLETQLFDLHRFSDEEQEEEGGWTGFRPRQRVVFAPAPTAEEVEEATRELHAALHLSIPIQNAGENNEHSSLRNALCFRAEPTAAQEVMDVSHTPPSIPANPLGLLAAGSSSVFYAFRLLQTSSQVQDVVKSLARDPAIWNAVTNNEKVVEMIQNLQHDAAVNYQPSNDDRKEVPFFSNFASMVLDYVMEATVQLFGKVVEIISSMFVSVEKTFVKDGADVDKTITSCVMLAVAVLILVTIKRTAI